MYKYTQEGNTDTVIRIADGKIIKIGISDPFSKAVQLWMSRGNTPLPADPDPSEIPSPEPTPESNQSAEPNNDEKPTRKIKKWRELREKS